MTAFRRWLMIALLAGGWLGCGPSLRMLHESTVYFERCYEAELRDDVAMPQRAACWERWLAWYSRGQEPARLLHARERLAYLTAGQPLDPLPTPEVAEAEIGVESTSTSGAGSSTPGGDAPADPHPHAPIRLSPRYQGSAVCESVCRPRWDTCIPRCDAAGRSCVDACEAHFRQCMQGCF